MKADDKSLNMPSSSINRELLSDLKHEMWQLLKVKYHASIGDRFIEHSLVLAVVKPWVGGVGGWGGMGAPDRSPHSSSRPSLWVKFHIIPEMMSH